MSAGQVLSIDARKWAETIEAGGSESLCSAVSAKNVHHVLSTATVRGPQKQLCAAVGNFVPAMLENTHGISVLTALVRYGTPATVEQVAGKLVAADPAVWSFKAAPKKELTKSLAQLLERLVYREDCTGESYKTLLGQLKSVKKQNLFSTSFTLPAAARLMVVDAEYAKAATASAESQTAFAKSCLDAALASAAEEFCRILFEDPNEDFASFVKSSLQSSLKSSAKAHPREAVLAVLATRAPVSLVDRLTDALAQWSNIHELCERDAFMQVVAHLLERTGDEKAGSRLVAAAITREADVTERMNSRKAAPHHLLAALLAKPGYAKTLEKQLGSSQTKRLMAAKVRFANATQPKANATQQAILEKLQKMSASGAGSKRARD